MPAETFDIGALEQRLDGLDLPRWRVTYRREHSPVEGSPHEYVYIYLTPEEYQGPHLIVSDPREWEAKDGYLIGRHKGEAECEEVERVDTLDEAVAWVLARVHEGVTE